MGYPKDLDDVQHEFGTWADTTFPKSTNESILRHFAREAVELVGTEMMEAAIANIKARGKWNARLGTLGADPQVTAFEMADCTMLMMHYAHRRKFSLNGAICDKFRANRERTWGPIDVDGVSEHVEPMSDEPVFGYHPDTPMAEEPE